MLTTRIACLHLVALGNRVVIILVSTSKFKSQLVEICWCTYTIWKQLIGPADGKCRVRQTLLFMRNANWRLNGNYSKDLPLLQMKEIHGFFADGDLQEKPYNTITYRTNKLPGYFH